jgi:hypothetical protein
MQLMLLITGGSVVGFVLWCVLDYSLVKYAPSRIHDFDWVGFVYLFIFAVVTRKVLRQRDIDATILKVTFVSLMVAVITFILIYLFGVGFHLSIGGKL